jgi:hypothetical protein
MTDEVVVLLGGERNGGSVEQELCARLSAGQACTQRRPRTDQVDYAAGGAERETGRAQHYVHRVGVVQVHAVRALVLAYVQEEGVRAIQRCLRRRALRRGGWRAEDMPPSDATTRTWSLAKSEYASGKLRLYTSGVTLSPRLRRAERGPSEAMSERGPAAAAGHPTILALSGSAVPTSRYWSEKKRLLSAKTGALEAPLARKRRMRAGSPGDGRESKRKGGSCARTCGPVEHR